MVKIKDIDGKNLRDINKESMKEIYRGRPIPGSRMFGYLEDKKEATMYPAKCSTCMNDPGAFYYASKKICEVCGSEQMPIKEINATIKNSDIDQDDFLENFYKNTMGILE